jgi:hypothetical protein
MMIPSELANFDPFTSILAKLDSATVTRLSEMSNPLRFIAPELAKAYNPLASIMAKLGPSMVSDPFRAFYTPEMISALAVQEKEAKRLRELRSTFANVGWWKSPAK